MKQNLSSKTPIAICLILFSILLTMNSFAASDTELPRGTIKGKIQTQDNKPAENVTVALMNTTFGTTTDEDGTFSLRAPQGKYTLVVRYIGHQPQETAVEIIAGKVITINFTLTENASQLSEVAISGRKQKY